MGGYLVLFFSTVAPWGAGTATIGAGRSGASAAMTL